MTKHLHFTSLMLSTVLVACGAPAPCPDGGAGIGGAGIGGGSATGGGGSATGGGGGAAQLRIDSITPQSVRAGEQLAVLGAGLAAAGVQQIRVGDTQLPAAAIKPGSSDGLMLIDAPPLIGLPSAGAVVTLQITTGLGTVQGTFTELPGVASFLSTATSLTPRAVTPGGTVQPNINYTVTIDVKIAASRDQTFDLSAAVEGAGFSIVDVVPGVLDIPASSAVTPVVTPVNVTVRAGPTGLGLVGLKVRPRGVASDGSILIPRVPLEVGVLSPSLDGVLFGDLLMFGPHGLDESNFVPVIRALSAKAATSPFVHFQLDVGAPADGGVLTVTNLTAPPGWTPATSGPVTGLAGGALSGLNVSFSPTVADGGFVVPNGDFSFTVEYSSTGKSRAFRGVLQVVR